MTQSHQSGRLKTLFLLALGIAVLLALIAPQVSSHLPLSFLLLTLVPLFLFAELETNPSCRLPDLPIASSIAPQADRRSRFQIPPPSAIA